MNIYDMDIHDIIMVTFVIGIVVSVVAVPVLWYHNIEKPAKQNFVYQATHICFYTSRGFAENETTECFPVDQVTYRKGTHRRITACIGVKCSSSYYLVK